MGLQKKVILWSNERLDLPDLSALQDYMYEYLAKKNQKFIANQSYVVQGFVPQNNGGLNVKMEVKNSVALNIESSGSGVAGVMWIGTGDSGIDPDLSAVLTNNSTNYLEIELITEDSALDTRAFWDPTANAGAGDEYTSTVNTCRNIKCQLKTNTVAYSGDPNRIVIGRVVTVGGAITTIYDDRDLFFRLNSDYPWTQGRSVPPNTSFSGADKSIGYWKDWIDAVMTTLKEIKGKEWYESFSSDPSLVDFLQDRNVTLIGGDEWDFNPSTNTLSWQTDSYFEVPGIARNRNTLPAGSNSGLTADGMLLYVDINRDSGAAANLTLTAVSVTAFIPSADRFVFARRIGDIVMLYNTEIVQRAHIYEETEVVTVAKVFDDILTLPFDSRESPPVAKKYKKASCDLQFWINGIHQERNKVLMVGPILSTTYSYNSGTGQVSIPNTFDLSQVRITDYFEDGAGSQFPILGGIDNVGSGGLKWFFIATGETVVNTADANIYSQDFEEIGTDWTWQTTIKTKRPIPVNAKLKYRVNPIPKAVVGTTAGGGGGGTGSLQDAYNNGRSVTVATGNPIEISGPGGEKLLKINGDMEVTGLVDPTGLQLTPLATNPIPSGKSGVWFKNTGEFRVYNHLTAEDKPLQTDPVAGYSYTNSTGGTLLKGRAIKKAGSTTINYADYNSLLNAGVIGILKADVLTTASGEFYKPGDRIPTGIITSSCFVEGSLPPEGSWVYLNQPDGKLSISAPTPASGKAQVFMGIWDNGGLSFYPAPWGLA